MPPSVVVLLAVAAVFTVFHRLGSFRTLGSHEVLAVVPAREMLRSGDFLVPRYAGRLRLRKPPFPYWVLAGSAAVFGELNEWTARLPAALAALGLCLLLGHWARSWYGPVAGAAAAAVQFTSVYVLIFARKAEIDMLLCLLTTAALYVFQRAEVGSQEAGGRGREAGVRSRSRQTLAKLWRVRLQSADNGQRTMDRFNRQSSIINPGTTHRSPLTTWPLIYSLLAGAWLAKFQYGPAMVLGPCLAFLVVHKRWRRLRAVFNPVGLAILAAGIIVWPLLLVERVPGAWDVWKTETLGRAVGDLGRQPVWFYVPHLLWLALPWTPVAIAAAPASWRRARRGDSRERFLWIWLVSQLAILSLCANKHKHYLLAALPMLSLLVGQAFQRAADCFHRGFPLLDRRRAAICGLACLLAASVLAVAGTQRWPRVEGAVTALAAAVAVGGCLVVLLLSVGSPRRAAWAALLTWIACQHVLWDGVMPARDHRAAAAGFAAEIRKERLGLETVSILRMGESEIVYYLGEPVRRLGSYDELAEHLRREGRLWLIAYKPTLADLVGIGRVQVRAESPILHETAPPEHPPLVLLEMRPFEHVSKAMKVAGSSRHAARAVGDFSPATLQPTQPRKMTPP